MGDFWCTDKLPGCITIHAHMHITKDWFSFVNSCNAWKFWTNTRILHTYSPDYHSQHHKVWHDVNLVIYSTNYCNSIIPYYSNILCSISVYKLEDKHLSYSNQHNNHKHFHKSAIKHCTEVTTPVCSHIWWHWSSLALFTCISCSDWDLYSTSKTEEKIHMGDSGTQVSNYNDPHFCHSETLNSYMA